jgi:hypothetical protein
VREWTSIDNPALPEPFGGWAALDSPLPDIKGFAMFYQWNVRWLDGLRYQTVPANNQIIPWVRLQTGHIARLHLTNPTNNPLRVYVTFYPSDGGGSVQQPVDIPALDRMVEDDLAGLFGVAVPGEGYLQLTASEGFYAQLEFGDDEARALLQGAPLFRRVGGQEVHPHFAEGGGWRSRAILTNITDTTANVQVAMYVEGGPSTPTVANLSIPARNQVVKEVWDLLGIDPPDGLRSGWLSFSGDLAALQTAMVFETEDGLLLAALPGQTVPRLRHTISHVAQNDEYFTGLAFVNDSGQTAMVDVFIYDQDGVLVRSIPIGTLADGTKFVRLLSADPFLLNQQLGGYIQIVSSRPIFSYALFGIGDMFLSAIPSQ